MNSTSEVDVDKEMQKARQWIHKRDEKRKGSMTPASTPRIHSVEDYGDWHGADLAGYYGSNDIDEPRTPYPGEFVGTSIDDLMNNVNVENDRNDTFYTSYSPYPPVTRGGENSEMIRHKNIEPYQVQSNSYGVLPSGQKVFPDKKRVLSDNNTPIPPTDDYTHNPVQQYSPTHKKTYADHGKYGELSKNALKDSAWGVAMSDRDKDIKKYKDPYHGRPSFFLQNLEYYSPDGTHESAGLGLSSRSKWIIALVCGLIFLVLASQFTYRFTNDVISTIGKKLGFSITTATDGNPNMYGILLHTLLFILVIRLII